MDREPPVILVKNVYKRFGDLVVLRGVSLEVGADGLARITFDTPGSNQYFCAIHPDMKATLTVR